MEIGNGPFFEYLNLLFLILTQIQISRPKKCLNIQKHKNSSHFEKTSVLILEKSWDLGIDSLTKKSCHSSNKVATPDYFMILT